MTFPQNDIAFMPDGKSGVMTRAVRDKTEIGAHRQIEIFSLQDGRARRVIALQGGSYFNTAPLSPAAKWLFDAGAKEVHLWPAQ